MNTIHDITIQPTGESLAGSPAGRRRLRAAAALAMGTLCALLTAGGVLAQTPSPDAKVIANINKLDAKNYACQSKANSLAAKTGDTTAYNDAVDKCDGAAAAKQAKVEATFPDAAKYDATQARAAAQDAARTRREIQDNQGRFVDPGDGTVIDLAHHLQWQKTVSLGTYTIGSAAPPFPLDGTAYASALRNLNGNLGDCFAGYCDWRLPTSEELRTLLQPAPCSPSCIDTTVFDAASTVWTGTSDQDATKNLLVDFVAGTVIADARDSAHVVRAVRQAPLKQLLNCGTSNKCVFVTSKVSTANLGGLSGADATCNTLASAAGMPGTYVAWLSDSSTDAITRVTSNGPFATRTGNVVAGSLGDLTDGTLGNPISQDENGNEVPLREVWTDTDPNGMRTFSNCNDWTSGANNAPYAVVGWNTATDGNWTAVFLQFCDRNISFYCVEQ